MAMAVTQIATAAAALSWMFAEWLTKGKPSVLGIVSAAGGRAVSTILPTVSRTDAFAESGESPLVISTSNSNWPTRNRSPERRARSPLTRSSLTKVPFLLPNS
jgi:hypothetical protein